MCSLPHALLAHDDDRRCCRAPSCCQSCNLTLRQQRRAVAVGCPFWAATYCPANSFGRHSTPGAMSGSVYCLCHGQEPSVCVAGVRRRLCVSQGGHGGAPGAVRDADACGGRAGAPAGAVPPVRAVHDAVPAGERPLPQEAGAFRACSRSAWQTLPSGVPLLLRKPTRSVRCRPGRWSF